MKYSFVLPAYKATFFREAVDSILSQTYKDFELIIVNDASPEDLDSIVNSYHDSRIQYYVNSENIGGKDLVAQWNHSISYAKGEYIILASDDDVYDLEYLEKMDKLVSKYPGVNVFRSRIRTIDAFKNTISICGYLPEYVNQNEFSYYWITGLIGSGIPYYILKRVALIGIGGYINFPSAWCSDDATVLLLSDNGVVSSQDILFSFRMSGLNISSTRNNPRLLESKLVARREFNNWLKSYVEQLKTNCSDDVCYLASMKYKVPSFEELSYYGVLASSTFKALILNVKCIFKYKCVSFVSYVALLFRSLKK